MTGDADVPSSGQALYFSRANVNEPLGTYSKHPFQLEDKLWPSVEHYFQAMKCTDASYQENIRAASHPKLARKWGRSWFIRVRKDWRAVKPVYMTRALYSKCKAYPEIAEKLLATGTDRLVENSQYDYYWGCGRDRRGKNTYGQLLMKVRDKLRAEQATEPESSGTEKTDWR